MHISDPLEQQLADALSKAGVRFVHESEDAHVTKALDFFLPDFGIYLEVKGGHTDRIAWQMSRGANAIAIQGMSSVAFICNLLGCLPQHSGHV